MAKISRKKAIVTTAPASAPMTLSELFMDNGNMKDKGFWSYYWTLNFKPLCRTFFETMAARYDYFPLMADKIYKEMFTAQVLRIKYWAEHDSRGLTRKEAHEECLRLFRHLFKRLESDIKSLGIDFDSLVK